MKEKVYKETKIRIKNGEQEIKWVKVGNKKKRLAKVKGNCKILTQTCQHFKEAKKDESCCFTSLFRLAPISSGNKSVPSQYK